MGLMDFINSLSENIRDEQERIDVNSGRADFTDRPGSLYISVNRESRQVSSVYLCDYNSREKEDSFKEFIRRQVKLSSSLPVPPDECLFHFYVSDLSGCPPVYKENNDHFIGYINRMTPLQRIELKDAAFALQNGIELIDNKGQCFSGYSGKVGQSEKYREFVADTEKKRDQVRMDYYIGKVEEEFREDHSVPRDTPLRQMIKQRKNDYAFQDMLYTQLNRHGEVGRLLKEMLYPVFYDTVWGKENISNTDMLQYVARTDMRFLASEYSNTSMLRFFQTNGLVMKLGAWDDAVKDIREHGERMHREDNFYELGMKADELFNKAQRCAKEIAQACKEKLGQTVDRKEQTETQPVRKEPERPAAPAMHPDIVERARRMAQNSGYTFGNKH